jgi:serine/threonine protein kinase
MTCTTCGREIARSLERCPYCGRPPSALRAGSLFADRYEIDDFLGSGGMGEVYKARDRELDEVVALKTLRPNLIDSPDSVRRFRAETRLARRVRHPNVCAVYDFGRSGDTYYLTMEHVEGVDLRKLLHGPAGLTLPEALDAALQTAQALGAIHECGIVHRDLKTSNLMRDRKGVVRIMDFGIAKQLGQTISGATAAGIVVGTPEYMSPEQIRGDPVDARSDLYALGVVIFELFSGFVPFQGTTPIATALKQLEEPPPIEGAQASRLPQALLPVLRRALAKRPADRYASAADMASALIAIRDDLLRGSDEELSPTVVLGSLASPPVRPPAAVGAEHEPPTGPVQDANRQTAPPARSCGSPVVPVDDFEEDLSAAEAADFDQDL